MFLTFLFLFLSFVHTRCATALWLRVFIFRYVLLRTGNMNSKCMLRKIHHADVTFRHTDVGKRGAVHFSVKSSCNSLWSVALHIKRDVTKNPNRESIWCEDAGWGGGYGCGAINPLFQAAQWTSGRKAPYRCGFYNHSRLAWFLRKSSLCMTS